MRKYSQIVEGAMRRYVNSKIWDNFFQVIVVV
jgi:hypothetical protein